MVSGALNKIINLKVVLILTCLALVLVLSRAQESDTLRFAVLGDYGEATAPFLAEVARMVKSWEPDIIVTVGDNNYPDGEAETIDANNGQFFHEYIYPYYGTYGKGGTENRFFPALGNHDWTPDDDVQPHLDYWTLPGNERYYDFVRGPVHFFILSSDDHEPDGNTQDSVQAKWLQKQLEESTAPWQIVVLHEAPYSSGWHGPEVELQWPFKEWGVDVVLSGHDHHYERLMVDGLPYFVNGTGGDNMREVVELLPESKSQWNASYGAMLVKADPQRIVFEYYGIRGVPLSDALNGQVGEWLELDVSDAVTEDGTYDFGVVTGSNTSIYFASEENNAHVPELVVETEDTAYTFTASDDSYIRGDFPRRNYGDDDELRLRYSELVDINAYLRFDVLGITSHIERATLRMYITDGEVKGGFAVYEVSSMDSSRTDLWREDTLTAETAPVIQGVNEPLDVYILNQETN